MKKTTAVLFKIILIVLLIFIGIRTYKSAVIKLQKQLYPLPDKYIDTIEAYSKEYNIPIELLCGIINTESSFTPSAYSNAGAIGIMQITEDTFNWLQFKSGEQHETNELFDYKTNIKFGTMLLHYLYEEFQDWDTTLAAYNAGRTRVHTWLEDLRYSKNGKLTNIPFEETANYLKKVNKAAQKYKELYFSEITTE